MVDYLIVTFIRVEYEAVLRHFSDDEETLIPECRGGLGWFVSAQSLANP